MTDRVSDALDALLADSRIARAVGMIPPEEFAGSILAQTPHPVLHDLSTDAGYRAAFDEEVARCGDPVDPAILATFDILIEEFSEVIKERSKLQRSANRAGFRKLSEPGGPTVMERLVGECYDVLVLMDMLFAHGVLDKNDFYSHALTKLPRLRRYSPEAFEGMDGELAL